MDAAERDWIEQYRGSDGFEAFYRMVEQER
jgi:hypothetical protein